MIFLTGIMQQGSLEHINQVQVDILMIDEHLQDLYLFKWITGMPHAFHITEAVKNRGAFVLI